MVFLCAGSLSLRKGIPYLLEAWRRLPPTRHAELWLVGKAELPARLLRDLPPNVAVRPPVPREGLEEIFRRSSVLVLPTLVEGLAHIVLEALSAGLAVVTTENSGCGALVEDGVNGWKVAIRDADALADRIAWCLDNPGGVADMQRQSLEKAAAWQERDFARTHAGLIGAFLSERGLWRAGAGREVAPAARLTA
jgi:glycosyltransferase involved in cell wall biosynthesis